MEQWCTLGVNEVCGMAGETPVRPPLPAGFNSLVSRLRYCQLAEQERVAVRERVSCLLTAPLPRSGEADPSRWERGWGEVLEGLKGSDFHPELLTPQYFKHDVVRLRGEYARVQDVRFEHDLFSAVRLLLIQRYFSSVNRVIELGAGTGINLVAMWRAQPGLQLFGADWARQSQEILGHVAEATGADITAIHLDMRDMAGAGDLPVNEETAVCTFHALEQLGSHFEAVLAWLLESRPQFCLHVEPVFEFYNGDDPFDRAAMNYHKKRNYLVGFQPALRRLAAEGRIELLAQHRMGFGSLPHEAYSLLVWKPTGPRR